MYRILNLHIVYLMYRILNLHIVVNNSRFMIHYVILCQVKLSYAEPVSQH